MELFRYKPDTQQINNSENQQKILSVLNQIADKILQKSNLEIIPESDLKTKLIQIYKNPEARKKLQKYLIRYLKTQSRQTSSEVNETFHQLVIGLGPAGLCYVYAKDNNSDVLAVRKSDRFHSSGVAYLSDQLTNSRKRTLQSVDPNAIINPKTKNDHLPSPADIVAENFVEGYLILELMDLYTAFSILLTGLNFLEGEVQEIKNSQSHYSMVTNLGDKLTELKSKNVVFATGLGDEKRLIEDKKTNIFTFAEFQAQSLEQKKQTTEKEIFLIGSGDSAALVIESLVKINPAAKITIIASESWDKISDTFGSRSRYGEYNQFLDIESVNNLKVIQSRAKIENGKILVVDLENPEIEINEHKVVISCIGFESVVPRVLAGLEIQPKIIKNSDNISAGLELVDSDFGKIIAVGCGAFINGFHLSVEEIRALNSQNRTGIKLENALVNSAHLAGTSNLVVSEDPIQNLA